jgi:hypothetical protein
MEDATTGQYLPADIYRQLDIRLQSLKHLFHLPGSGFLSNDVHHGRDQITPLRQM